MPTEPAPVTLAAIVHRAVVAVDPDGQAGIEDLLERFEDDDEPVGSYGAEIAVPRIAEEAGKLDPKADDTAGQPAAAVATYLAFRRDELAEEPQELLALAARAEFAGHPPDDVRAL